MKKTLFRLLSMAITLPMMFTACGDDKNNGGKDPEPTPPSTLTTQEQVDKYKGGAIDVLTLDGIGITDLSGLDVTSARALIIRRTGVVNLKLPKLTKITEKLTIDGNTQLVKIEDLSNLADVAGEILINNNSLLTDISGLLDLAKVDGKLTVTNNKALGEDKPLEGDDYSYGLFPVKYLYNNNIVTGAIKLSGNHPDAATEVDKIGEMGNIVLPNFTFQTKDEVNAFIPPVDGIVGNLTFQGSDIGDDEIAAVVSQISVVKGTYLFDGVSGKADGSEFMSKTAFSGLDVQGSIIFKNISVNISPWEGFQSPSFPSTTYPNTIKGDFIFENCPGLTGGGHGWTCWGHIEKIEGDFKSINSSGIKESVNGFFNGEAFGSLKEVGGDFIFEGCGGGWWDFHQAKWVLERIGGDFTIQDCPGFESLRGIHTVKYIGGNVTIKNNNPHLPIGSEKEGRGGYDIVKYWQVQGYIQGTVDCPAIENWAELSPWDGDTSGWTKPE